VHVTIGFALMKAAASLLYLREEELTDGIELFFFAGRDVGRVLDERLQALGLGRAHYRALHFVARHPGLPVSDLLSILGITKQSLSRVVRSLTADGYLSQTQGARDRRQRLLRLTAKGLELEADLSRVQRGRFANAYREAGPEAVAGFKQVLSGLLADQERAGVLRLIAKR
jgi:DNA-binding MarR family transcriptional regulator